MEANRLCVVNSVSVIKLIQDQVKTICDHKTSHNELSIDDGLLQMLS